MIAKTSLLLVALCGALAPLASAETLKEASINQIYNEVRVIDPATGARPAKLQDKIRGKAAVRTGVKSRSELVFDDLTVTRLGANTSFSFNEGTRKMRLSEGTMLLQVPKKAGGATITTAAVTAAITGTTVMWSTLPNEYIKFIVLESGKPDGVRLYLNNKPAESILVPEGAMVILPPNPTSLKDVRIVFVNLKTIVRTSGLIQKFDNVHTPFRLGPIQPVIVQQDEKFGDELLPTNLVIVGDGTSVIMAQDYRTNADQTISFIPPPEEKKEDAAGEPPVVIVEVPPASIEATPPPVFTDAKLGPPSSFPGTFTVDQSTTIITDPFISYGGGLLHEGKIYRSLAEDGPLTTFASLTDRGGTFDQNASVGGINGHAGGIHTPLAVFRFDNLVLAGGPGSINTVDGPTNVALISGGNITSGPLISGGNFTYNSPGGMLDFTGLDYVLLATNDGFIDLSSPLIGYSGAELNLHARGTNGYVSTSIFISLTGPLFIDAQSDVFLNGSVSAPSVTVFAGGNFFGSSQIMTPNASFRVLGTLTPSAFQFDSSVLTSLFLEAGTLALDSDFTVDPSAISILKIGAGGITGMGRNVGTISSLTSVGNVTVADLFVGSLAITAGSLNATGTVALAYDGSTILEPVNEVFAQESISVGESLFAASVTAVTGDINVGLDLADSYFPGDSVVTLADKVIAGGDITVGGVLASVSISSGGNIVAGGITSSTITTAGSVTSNETGENPFHGIGANSISAGGNVVSATDIFANTITTPGNISATGVIGGRFDSGPMQPTVIYTANTIVGGATLQGTGQGEFTGSPATDGRSAILNVTTLDFGTGGVSSANFRGGDASQFRNANTAAGDGGSLIVNASGPINVNATINASTGTPSQGQPYSGAGGTVELNSSGDTVTIAEQIVVSEVGEIDGSASGGTIRVRGNKPAGVAIQVASTAQISALLASGQPGAGGVIEFTAQNGGIAVSSGAGINASSKGTIALRTNATDGNITIDGAFLDASGGTIDIRAANPVGGAQVAINGASIFADMVKIGALGQNGVLTINSGSTISAQNVLKLYGGAGANGRVQFTGSGNIDLTGNPIRIAAKTVAVDMGTNVQNNGTTLVNADSHNYNIEGLGSFQNPVTQGPLSGREPFDP